MRSSFRRLFFFCYRPKTPSFAHRSRTKHRSMASSSTLATLYAVTVSASAASPAPEDVANKSHHKGKDGFINPWDSWDDMNLWGFARKMIGKRLAGEIKQPDTTPPTVPVQKPEFLPSRDTSKLRATWLGHACYYVEFPGGLRVLFDPVFEDRCSPLSWMGPKRYTEVPCQIAEIPTIDAVVISHNHYDHLSYHTVKEISQMHPNCHFFAPLGNKTWFTESGINQMTELDWWDARDLRLSPSYKDSKDVKMPEEGSSSPAEISARISCLPCQHFSGRGLTDRAKTLWASWSVESGGKKVYFAGDTGYRTVPELPGDVDDHGPDHNYPHCPAFKQIGEFRGPFDLGLIPIGAYQPRFIMSRVHADPHDAVNIFQDTRCKKALGMHWGTWVLTNEEVLEPPRKLKEALQRHELPTEGTFDVCNIGESREF